MPHRTILLFSLLSLCLLYFLLPLPPKPTFFHHHHQIFSRFPNPLNPCPPPPRIAYFIAGSNGDVARILRLVHALYHPRNQYLLHLDLRVSKQEREKLAILVGSVEYFVAADNVNVVGKANSVNNEGSTPLALVLHGAAMLLRYCEDWDWFVNLDASDYPLISQDDFLHILSYVPRSLNFIEHTGNISRAEYQRIIQIIVDPGLYLGIKGSPHVILSRKLIEFSILGWDNLPRTLLLYFSNTKFSRRGYFQTLACNSKEFSDRVINSNLRFTALDNTTQKERQNLRLSDLNKMLGSGAAFAGKFSPNDPVLDMIDSLVLHRNQGMISPGGWCLGRTGRGRDPCQQWGDTNILRPGPAGKRFEKLLLRLMANMTLHSNICI
ncbi:hypothetical protein L1049_011902 [Liquidambar formosana]|uniref:Uncharacterized protein n=1 Tax=Liquidambar formosana TaxID=63359 RepID=A0AAP0RXW6_LIQFO